MVASDLIWAALWEPWLLEVPDPGAAHQPLPECQPTPWLCPVDMAAGATTRERPQHIWSSHCGPSKLSMYMIPSPVNTHGGHAWSLLLQTSPESEKVSSCPRRAMQARMLGQLHCPIPELTATQPEVVAGAVPTQGFFAEDWDAQPAAEMESAALTAQASEWGGSTMKES